VGRRSAAALVVLALAAGGPAVCAGWMPTPEARMACCSDERPCPMHTSESDQDGSTRLVTQAEADRCCATSEQDDSVPSSSNISLAVSLALAPSPVAVLLPDGAVRADAWRTPVPILVTRVPKHLLLSVFLI
jgi:hypothetical protein